MSMSTHVIGIKPPDARWERMKAAYDACHLAGVDVPAEVEEFFNDEAPDSAGVVVAIQHTAAVTEWRDETSEGLEVNLAKLPSDITVIRFVNSW